MKDDEISQAFEGISVEDFLRDTSALEKVKYTKEQLRYTVGRNNFMGFVDAQVRRCHENAARGNFSAFSILHCPTEQRTYSPDNDETAPHYARRLTREANDMDATWFFTAMIAPGRAFDASEGNPPQIDPDNPEQIEEALRAGSVQLSICWFAASSDADMFHRSGIIILDDEHQPVRSIEGDIDPDTNPFHNVMEDRDI